MHIENIHIHLGRRAAGAALAALFPGLPGDELEPVGAIPAIGSYWPGQGGIYVGASRGWEGTPDGHLILPTDLRAIFTDARIGTDGIDVTGATSDRDGRANTLALAEAGSELCQSILALEIDGHQDFFLMAPRDAALCFANVPELFLPEWYLTSRQCSASAVWGQDFVDGCQLYDDEEFSARARACRRLIL